MRPLTVPVKGVTALFLALAMVFAFAARASALPKAEFTFDVAAPVVGQPVTFTFTGACDVAPCRIRWTWFTTGGSALGTLMGEGPALTYAFPAVETYSVVAHITNSTPTHGSASMTHAVAVAGTVPSAPRNVTAVSAAHNQATVTWDVPGQSGGEPVTSYQVTVEDGTPNSTSVSGADLTATLLNIPAGTFPVRVTAVNSHGASAPATASVTVAPAVVAAPPAAPGAPRATAVRSGGVTTVRWAAAADSNGAPLLHYLVTVDGRLTVVKNTATALTVKGLRAGPAKILVRAKNQFGVSRAAATKIVVPRSVARAPKVTLRLGMHGAAVKRLQIALQMRRHSGEFGRSTRAAVRAFQQARGLDPTGKASDRIRYLLAV